MIINHNQKPEAQYVGEIKANKVGIDTKNLDFIASLLTTNLYSNPIQSFLRETISNGWDSHIEAGVKQPVLVSLHSPVGSDEFRSRIRYWSQPNQAPLTITIRDFGVGLSPERFANIYTNIGSSTKRDSNDFIGAFGIGRFSCLSCADSATLTSYHDGTKYSYLMYKDGSGINIDELGRWETEESNGLEVQVSLTVTKDKLSEIKHGFVSLIYFNCIYLDDAQDLLDGFAKKFNNRQIGQYKTFNVYDYSELSEYHYRSYDETSDLSILVGNCLYPFTKKQLAETVGIPHQWRIAVKFNIGELDVTPNREAILYNQKTDEAIKKRFTEVLDEIKAEVMRTTNNLNFTSLIEYYKIMKNQSYILNLDINDKSFVPIIIKHDLLNKWDYLKGSKVNSKEIPSTQVFRLLQRAFGYYLNEDCIKFYFNYDSKKYYSKVPSFASLSYEKLCTIHRVVTTREPIWRAMLKDYTKDQFKGRDSHSSIFLVISKDRALRQLKWDVLPELIKADKPYNGVNLRFILENINLESFFTEINESSIPTEYKTNWEAARKAERQSNSTSSANTKARTCVIYTCQEGSNYDYNIGMARTILDTTRYTLQDLGKVSSPIVYTTNTAGDNLDCLKGLYALYKTLFNVSIIPIFIAVASTNIPTIAALPNAISLEEFLSTERQEFTILCSIDSQKRYIAQSMHGFILKSSRITSGNIYNTIHRYLDVVDIIKRNVYPKGNANTAMQEILAKGKANNWKNAEIESIQNNTKLWDFLTLASCFRDAENVNTAYLLAELAQRFGLDTMTDQAYADYLTTDCFKHIKIEK